MFQKHRHNDSVGKLERWIEGRQNASEARKARIPSFLGSCFWVHVEFLVTEEGAALPGARQTKPPEHANLLTNVNSAVSWALRNRMDLSLDLSLDLQISNRMVLHR
jgi:hypothetical protein